MLGSTAPDWAAGRIALVGGAAHAPLPELRQDSSAAIEDAWVLSRLLDQWEDDPVSALRDYHRYREPRGRQLATFEAWYRGAVDRGEANPTLPADQAARYLDTWFSTILMQMTLGQPVRRIREYADLAARILMPPS